MFHIIVWFFLLYLAILVVWYCKVKSISTPYDDFLENGGY